jgi:superfamily II DNA/RNA helicase
LSTTFADLGVPAPIERVLARHGIDQPFPIQAATLPDGLAGRDLCGRAPTGSGKTIAFGIPIVTRVGSAQPRRPRALVLVPTRELAAQVRDELIMLAGPGGASVEAFYGGQGFDRQLRALRKGVDIVVACPGRLADLIGRNEVRLDQVEVVVIDEADRMADMGFLPEVRRLLDATPRSRQTLLFSATLDGAVDVLVRDYQRNPSRHELPVDPRDGARVDHYFWNVARDKRVSLGARVIKALGPTVVFCRTKRGAERVARQLEAAGVNAAAIHGDRSQGQRERALAAFGRGQVEALVATDVAARGIHVDGVAGVLHLDPPADEKDYVHRSGRTGRAGAPGVVVSFVAPEQRKDVTRMQRALGRSIDIVAPDLTVLPVLAEQPSTPRARTTARTTVATIARPPGKGRTRRTGRPNSPTGRGTSSERPSSGEGSTRSRRPSAAPGAPKGKRRPKSRAKSTTGAPNGASSARPGNRKARRAHLQPGASAAAPAAGGERRSRSGAAKAGKGRSRSTSRSASAR